MFLLSTDIDGTIYDGPKSAQHFAKFWSGLREQTQPPLLVYNSGRSVEDIQKLIEDTNLPEPDFIIGGVGTEMFDASSWERVFKWEEKLNENWDWDRVAKVVKSHAKGIKAQPEECQNPFKCSWYWRDQDQDAIDGLAEALKKGGLEAQVIYSSDRDLDILPKQANKGNAIAWMGDWLGVPREDIVVAGDSGNDSSMFRIQGVSGIVVANAEDTLKELGKQDNVFQSRRKCSRGVEQGLNFWMDRRTQEAEDRNADSGEGIYFVHISVHGLIRGEDLELGRDADTGGQCKYVLELVKALAENKSVDRVDLLTRLVADPKVSEDYAKPEEPLGNGASIRRIHAGPRRYVRKEALWRYMDAFVDQCLAMFHAENRLPDVIHAHYADAGYVGSRLAMLLGCPFVFTGHSLGRTKLEQLLKNGQQPDSIERRYNLATRIEAEELSLDAASIIVTSTNQEVEKQYSIYDQYVPNRKRVIPPGVDVSRFSPPGEAEINPDVAQRVERFLGDPEKPCFLAVARADEKKNLASLVKAFGESKTLRKDANLILIAGNRDSIQGLNAGARKVWSELLRLIDDYDLYGSIAIPKHHKPDEVPVIFRYAASKKGIFVNPALTEPFGLTLIEAAASGLPMLATNDGGPRDIMENCQNGKLIDPLDVPAMTLAMEDALSDPARWEEWSANGLKGVYDHYTWKGHVDRYLIEVAELLDGASQAQLMSDQLADAPNGMERIIFTGMESNLLKKDPAALKKIRKVTEESDPSLGFGIVSGRSLQMVLDLIETQGIPEPEVYITQLGGEIHYGSSLKPDLFWTRHLSHRWEPETIRKVLDELEGLRLQEEEGHQHRFKISYEIAAEESPGIRKKIHKVLRESNLQAKVILSENRWLDVIPLRSGKGQAARYVAMRFGIPADRVLYFARRGSDHEALGGQFLSVLASDHSRELRPAKSLPRVYRAKLPNFSGLWEGIKAYGFDAGIRIPESAAGLQPEHSEEQEAVLAPDMVAHVTDGE